MNRPFDSGIRYFYANLKRQLFTRTLVDATPPRQGASYHSYSERVPVSSTHDLLGPGLNTSYQRISFASPPR